MLRQAVVILCILFSVACRARPLDIPTNKSYLPVVLWHGKLLKIFPSLNDSLFYALYLTSCYVFNKNFLNTGMGDSCCWKHSIGAVSDAIKQAYPGVFIHSIATGKGQEGDVMSSYFGNVNSQIDTVCNELLNIPELSNGFSAVGFSQGGQFLRGVVQRCGHFLPPIHTLVTMGSQHQGVMDIPGCWSPSFNTTPSWGCKLMEEVLGLGAYIPWIQRTSVQAQYFKDPVALDSYYKNSIFLADVNVESETQQPGTEKFYKKNLLALQRLVLFQFDNDVTVVPKESAHFGFFDGEKLLDMEDTDLYKEDRIGLRELNERGDLHLLHSPGFHMQFSLEWFIENVVEPWLLAPAGSIQQGISSS